jgi:hypothetical protein
MVQDHSLEMFDFEYVEYFDIVRKLIEEYRLLFIDWVAGFDRWDYIIDRSVESIVEQLPAPEIVSNDVKLQQPGSPSDLVQSGISFFSRLAETLSNVSKQPCPYC